MVMAAALGQKNSILMLSDESVSTFKNVKLIHFLPLSADKYAPFKQSSAIHRAINQISTMMLMRSPAVISLNRHGQRHSWELIYTPIYFLHNKYMQEIFSKKMEYLISHLNGFPNAMHKFPRLFMMRVARCKTC